MISSVELRGEIKKQMDIRRWSYDDLARATGYKKNTVVTYMSDTPRNSVAFERSARLALGINEV